ncbi:MAG TPA: glycoside hydrolase family 20 zincin-like fold domain-containing protein, partial [Rhodothermales bacterium]|nr:glycoside hydrolase family 20 zincin-like fold domain-containing protein [Rhodothermales bacterium]
DLVTASIGPVADDRIDDEGYILEVGSDGIRIQANTDQGAFYGQQTVKQLVRGFRERGEIPGMRIVDWPDLAFRGISDDISRGPVPTPEFLRRQIDRLAEMKFNALTYYTEHVVRTESHPEFAPFNGSIDIQEWEELADYARERHVTLLGNFQSFGHFERILEHPKYAPLGEAGKVLSPVLPESRALLRDIYSEMVPAFDAEVFVANGDETFDLGRGPSKPRADSLGIGVVYAEHMLNIKEILDSLGVGMVMWGDVLLQHEDALRMIPPEVVVGTWDYTPRDSYDFMITPFVEKGHPVLICTGVLHSSRIMPEFQTALNNIRLLTSDGVRLNVLGLLNTVWDDGGSAFFSRNWYGVAYAADHGWNSRRDPNEDARFDVRFSIAQYADSARGLVDAIHYLNRLADLEPTDGMTEKVLWAKLVPDRGQSLRISMADWDEVVMWSDSATSALERSVATINSTDLAYFSFTADLYRHMARVRENLLLAASNYAKATLLQRTDREKADDLLAEALHAVGSSRESVAAISDEYERLWLMENRPYALDWTIDRFDGQDADLADVERRLTEATDVFSSGEFLPSPTEVRLAITESEGKYFREWLMSGTLPNDSAGAWGSQIDYLEAMGGELGVRPGVADEWEYDGATYRWHRNETPYHAEVNLAELYPKDVRHVAMYAFATITSPRAKRVRATVGSNDSIKIILNGEVVFENSVKRALIVDADVVWLDLKEGRNDLLLKISQGTGDWGFSFRLPDEVVRSRKNRYRIVE